MSGAAAATQPAPAFTARYLLGLFGGAVASLAVFLGGLVWLDRTGHLPPPPLANSICVDEKLAQLRDDHAEARPNVLVVGSSVAWRHFDGEAVVRRRPGAAPLNGGFCGLRMNQTAAATEWLLDRYPSTREVVAIVAPMDFESCTDTPSAFFDSEDAHAFVSGERWLWSFYFRYFEPQSILRNALSIKRMRENRGVGSDFGSLWADDYGTSPILAVHSRGLFYGPTWEFEPGCFDALRRLAEHVEASGRRLVVATTPLQPSWLARYDPSGEQLAGFTAALRNAVAGTGAGFWDGHSALALGDDAFFDAIHIFWSAAQRFSATLVDATNLGASGTSAQAGLR